MENPLVSVIVTTKNEAKNIENCLRSVVGQTYARDCIEIIVVDNNSTDATVSMAREYTELVFTKGPERSAQRNFGVAHAHGEYVLYLDADMILSPTVVADCVGRITTDANMVGLYISEVVMGDSFWCQVRRFERSFYDATVIDCVRFVRRSAFDAAGGFDETMTGPEDWDFDKRIRSLGQVALIKTPLYHNESEFNLKKYLKKKAYYTKSLKTYAKKWGANDPDIKKQLGALYRFLGVFTENGKWYNFVSHPLMACSVWFLKAALGLFMIKNMLAKRS